MDALKAEIATKRKAIQDDPLANRPNKYMRRGDIERLREEAEHKAREEKRKLELEEEARKAAVRAEKETRKNLVKVSHWHCVRCPCPNSWLENSHRLHLQPSPLPSTRLTPEPQHPSSPNRSIFQMKILYAGCALRASPFVSLERPIKTVASG